MNLMIQPNQICLIVKLYNNRPELLPDSNVLQQLRFIKFHTRAQGKSLDRLTVETSFIFGFATFQALPVKIGLGVVFVTRLPWIRSLHSPVL